MKRIEKAIIIALIFSVIVGSFSAFASECNNIRGSVLRLHILANSDSAEDQTRDKTQPGLLQISDKDDFTRKLFRLYLIYVVSCYHLCASINICVLSTIYQTFIQLLDCCVALHVRVLSYCQLNGTIFDVTKHTLC